MADASKEWYSKGCGIKSVPGSPEMAAHTTAATPGIAIYKESWVTADMIFLSASIPFKLLHGISTPPAMDSVSAIASLLTPMK